MKLAMESCMMRFGVVVNQVYGMVVFKALSLISTEEKI